MNCTICKGNGESVFTKNKYKIMRCGSCGHHYTGEHFNHEKIQEIYSDRYFFGGADGYPDYTRESEMLIRRGEYYAKKIRNFIAEGTVFDVGSAAGYILKGFENMGWKGSGIDPNETMVKHGRKNLDVDLHHGTLESVRIEQEFDLVLMIQVVAHLYDLKASINSISAKVRPGGYLLIETWNRESLTARILGKNWHEYSPPSTLNFFSKSSLDKWVSNNGFDKVGSGRPKKGISGKHAKTLIKHSVKDSKLFKWLIGLSSIVPDNFVIPYPAEDLFWSLYIRSDR
jgi:SAM-dependent methyltransferase